MEKYRKEKISFIKYMIINGLLTGAYFLLYYLLVECINMNYMVSNAIAYVITVLTAYYMTKAFVFKSSKDGKKEFILFVVVRVVMVASSSLGLWVCVSLLSMGEYTSFILVNVLCFLVSYLLNKWIFTEACK